jgi:hypothetical protein
MGKAVLKVALMVIAAVATAWVVLYLMIWLFSDASRGRLRRLQAIQNHLSGPQPIGREGSNLRRRLQQD